MTSQGDRVRLNKYLASQLVIGRRQADDYIAAGRVELNGSVATLGDRIDPATDSVAVDGKPLLFESVQANEYVALHKPVGYVCSRRQQGESPTIYSLLPHSMKHLKPVGRLDKDSSGLLLLTNDGDFAHTMTHPSFHKTKTYEVTLDKPLMPLHHQMINDHGIELEDGNSRLQLSRMQEGNDTHWTVHMHEGRNRQIRRTFAALGYTVVNLYRTKFGPYDIHNLKEGQYEAVHKA